MYIGGISWLKFVNNCRKSCDFTSRCKGSPCIFSRVSWQSFQVAGSHLDVKLHNFEIVTSITLWNVTFLSLAWVHLWPRTGALAGYCQPEPAEPRSYVGRVNTPWSSIFRHYPLPIGVLLNLQCSLIPIVKYEKDFTIFI